MKYVSTLHRIVKINEALDRMDNSISFVSDEKYDSLYDKLWDKHDALVKSIKDYIRCPDRTNKELRKRSYVRRKQVKLACKYLNIDYYRL